MDRNRQVAKQKWSMLKLRRNWTNANENNDIPDFHTETRIKNQILSNTGKDASKGLLKHSQG